jgi:signal transduction histidine kinase
MQRRLYQQNEELKNFTSILAHDFSSPLSNIVRGIDILSRQLKDVSDVSSNEMLELVRSQANKSLQTIKSLHMASRQQLASDSIMSFELSTVIDDLKEVLINDLEEKNATIHLLSKSRIVGNKEKIKILFQNLIVNSLRYSDKSPIITIDVSDEGIHHLINYTDNGRGIAPEVLANIFKPFRKGDDSEGIGLGLYNVKNIINDHNGTINIESTVGVGTAFIMTIKNIIR